MEYIIIGIVCFLVAVLWVTLWVSSEGSFFRGVFMAVTIPFLLVLTVTVIGYVIYCFVVVIDSLLV